MNRTEPQSLYLLRHALTEPWQLEADDFERPLSPQGIEQMLGLAHWMEAMLKPPEMVLCSPALRTRQTLREVAASWPQAADMADYPAEVYEASAGTLHALASETFRSVNRVLLVGHNPGLENLLMRLIPSAKAVEIGRMSPGTLAVIDFAGGWDADNGRGRLRHWIDCRDLDSGAASAQVSIDSE